MPTFWKNNSTSFQLHVDRTCTHDLGDVTETFTKHVFTTCSESLPLFMPISVFCSDFLLLVFVTELYIQKAVKRLRPTKSVGLGDIPGFRFISFSSLIHLYFPFFTFTIFLYMFRTGWSIIRRIKCLITQAASSTVPCNMNFKL